MNNRAGFWIRLVNRSVRQRLGRGNRGSFKSERVPLEIVSHYFCAVCRRQFGYATGRRTGDKKIVGRAVPYAQVPKPNAI